MILWNFIKDHLLANPGQTICEEAASLSFEDVATRAEELAVKLRGIRCCAILCDAEMATALSLLACFAAGVTAMPLSVRYGAAHCRRILDAVDPDAILTDTGGRITVSRLKDSQYMPPKEHPALIMCTSGTTGKPKGAMLSERNIVTNVSDIAEYFTMDTRDTILIARPLYHCAVLTGEFLTALVRGACIRFYSGQFNPVEILGCIADGGITAFCSTPTLLSVLARYSLRRGGVRLRHISVSGECMSAETGAAIRAAFPCCHIYHVYGLTEACPRVCYLPPERFDDYPDCVGIPLRSVSVRLLNREGKPCRPGEEGMLYVKGDNVMIGYYREPEKTRRILQDGWLRTGDIALINDAGLLKIKGRDDDLIIRCGMNIYPAEIESTLMQDPRVREALVYGYGNRLGMQIGLRIAGDFASIEEVRQLCVATLPPFAVPSDIGLVEALQRNGSGKIVRRSPT